jgi:undecaprenyl phosphate N,N'-diacetylbacillosamine 1-phosphate transferase
MAMNQQKARSFFTPIAGESAAKMKVRAIVRPSGLVGSGQKLYEKRFKRVLDIVISAAALIVLSPLLGGIAWLVRIKMGKPVVFKQVRSGWKDASGQENMFTLYKFRSMTNERDVNGRLLSDQDRLTWFGRTLRKTSLDELPELWNILKGDMSLIGPRPLLVRDMVFMTEEQRQRHSVRPGLSGLAQINGRNCIKWENKLDYDLEYVRRITFLEDLRIGLITIVKVFKTESISFEGMATAEDFGDYLLRCGKVTGDTYMERQREALLILENKPFIRKTPNWVYYHHAIVPTTAPHKEADINTLRDVNLWRSAQGYPLLARWTSDFDCKEDTGWWYEIKDTPFDLAALSSKHRYGINKGLKHFDVRVVDPTQYAEELYQVQEEAFSTYPAKYRPNEGYDQFVGNLKNRRMGVTFCAFSKEDGSMAGYAYLLPRDGYVVASVLKARPSQEKNQVNAALVFSVLEYFKKELERGVYIMAGERNIVHETQCQEYMEKTFGFRKAYCKLHISYRSGVRQFITCLYPIRGLMKKLDDIKLFNQINSVLKMEEIARGCSDFRLP